MGLKMRAIRRFLLHYPYLSEDQLGRFTNYEYQGLDTNPFNNKVSMPICDRIAHHIPSWIAPNVLTLTTFILSLVQYLLLAFYDYKLLSSSIEETDIDHIPNWIWLFSGVVLIAAIILDALDGKHARRIGACSPVGEIFDHSVDWWRLTAPMITCFFSLFGRLEYGLPAYRLMWLLVATQAVVISMFWHQHVTGILVYSWGYDLMQYLAAFTYFFTYFQEDAAEWWQDEAYDTFTGTNAVVTEKFAYLLIFGISLPMQLYYSVKHEFTRGPNEKSFLDMRPMIPFFGLSIAAVFLTWQNKGNSIIEEDPRACLWLVGIVCCDMLWRLLLASMTKSACPRWNRLLTLFMTYSFYCFFRPQSLLSWDGIAVRSVAVIATLIHLHLIACTLNQMCHHFGIYFLSVQQRPVLPKLKTKELLIVNDVDHTRIRDMKNA